MYEVGFYGMSTLLLVMGAILIAFPKICTKKEYQDIPQQIKNTRKMGYVYVGFGILLLLVKYLIDL